MSKLTAKSAYIDIEDGFLIIKINTNISSPSRWSNWTYYENVEIDVKDDSKEIHVTATERRWQDLFCDSYAPYWIPSDILEETRKLIEGDLKVEITKPERNMFGIKTGRILNRVKTCTYLLREKKPITFRAANYKIE